ncbi:MAG: hypothetical protein ABFC62_03825 [Clostridiaceae bacterium]|nr:hypothetical protein [Eubacteriales bacterium]
MKNLHVEIEKEREKFAALVKKALESGQPIAENDAILAQDRKLERLFEEAAKQRLKSPLE